MLGIQFIRENLDKVKKGTADKGMDPEVVDQLIVVDDRRRTLIGHIDELRQKRNEITEKIPGAGDDAKKKLIEEASAVKDELQQLEDEMKDTEERFLELLQAIPNVTSERMPFGKDDGENVVMHKWGEKPEFDFEPKDHIEIGKELDLIDVEKSGEISGSRFYYIKNEAVLLQFAIVQLVFDTLTNEETLKKIAKDKDLDVSTKPFMPMLPPVIMKKEVMKKMDRLDPEDDRYTLDADEQVFVGSAEHTTGPYHMNEILDKEQLPIRYIAYSTAFRREAGSYGKDVKGILRVHQFDKLEMETFTTEEKGQDEQDFIVAIQEYLVQQLELPYQLIQICTGDTGKPDYNQYDIECWIPTQNKYRETHTSDYMTDYQARRLNTRYEENGEKKFAYMNDATAFAMSRILIAILENYQQKDGSVKVPKVLQKYLGKKVIERKKEDRKSNKKN